MCDFERQRGKYGKVSTWNYKKTSVVRVEWKQHDIQAGLPTMQAKAAFAWLTINNATYAHDLNLQKQNVAARENSAWVPKFVQTAELLLNAAGIEVVARPILYPHHAYGDTDLKERLTGTHC